MELHVSVTVSCKDQHESRKIDDSGIQGSTIVDHVEVELLVV